MKLYKKRCCAKCEDYVAGQKCSACGGTSDWFEELDPADLKALDMAALGVLEELKKWIVQEKETPGVHPHEGAIYQDLRQKLTDLESGLSVPEAVIKAMVTNSLAEKLLLWGQLKVQIMELEEDIKRRMK